MNAPYTGFPGTTKVSYKEELKSKESFLHELFGQEVQVLSAGSKHYRNKIEFATTPNALGLKRTWDDVVDLTEVPILDQALNEVWKQVRAFIKEHRVPCYDPVTQTGWLRYVTLRSGVGVQVILTTTTDEHKELAEAFAHALDVRSVWWMTNATREGAIGKRVAVFGEELLEMRVCDKRFLTRPDSFFQAHIAACELALEQMRPYVSETDTVLDLYCGVGVLGQCLAHTSLVGVETNNKAIALATQNAALNNVQAEYFAADAARIPKKSFDVVIVDPPRAGLGTAVHTVLALKPKRIVYLSCNPKTQRRDIAALKAAYTVSHLVGIDFFPRTAHVECLAVLDRR